jgi:excisionase family DNA binding protein
VSNELLTVRQVAERLGFKSAATVYKWSQQGRIPRVVLGPRSIRFRAEDIERFVDERLESTH